MLSWVVLVSFHLRRTPPCRHVTKIPSPQLLYFPQLQTCDARNPFRIRSYANCRVSLSLSSLFLLFVPRVFSQLFCNHALANSFAPSCACAKLNPFVFNPFRTLCEKPPGVGYPRKCLPQKQQLPPPTCLRLFDTLSRIPARMSASISCLTPASPIFF